MVRAAGGSAASAAGLVVRSCVRACCCWAALAWSTVGSVSRVNVLHEFAQLGGLDAANLAAEAVDFSGFVDEDEVAAVALGENVALLFERRS